MATAAPSFVPTATASPSAPLGAADDDEDCSGEAPLWALGLFFGLLGSVCINTGNNIQSLGLHELAELDEADKDRALAKGEAPPEPREPGESRVWKAGTTVFVTGALLNFASYAFAPSAMLAPLEAIQFVTNIFFSKFMLKKRITNMMYAGTCLIVLGTVSAVIFCSKAALCATPHTLKTFYLNPAYQAFLAFCVLCIFGLQAIHKAYAASVGRGAPYAYAHYILPITYAAWSAIFGTQSVVQAKCLSVILVYYSSREPVLYPAFLNYWTYLTLVAWLSFVSVWLYRMNEALGLYDPIFIIPLLQVDFILFAIVAGGIYFKEFDSFTAESWIGFSLGVVMICVGLFMLAPPTDDAPPKRSQVAPIAADPATVSTAVEEYVDDDPNIVTLPKDSPVALTLDPTPTAADGPRRHPTFDNSALLAATPADPPRPRTPQPTLDLSGVPEDASAKTLPSGGSGGDRRPRSSRLALNTRRLSYVTSVATQYNINELHSARSANESARRRRSLTSDLEGGRRPGTASGPLEPLTSPALPARPATSNGASTSASATPLAASDGNDGELGDVLHDLNGLFAGAQANAGDKGDKEDPSMCTI